MNRILILLITLSFLVAPVSAMDFTAPDVPETAQKYMPDTADDFGEGLKYVLKSALELVEPSLFEALRTCVSVLACGIIVGILSELSGKRNASIITAGSAVTGIVLFRPANSLIHLGTETVAQISQYGKLLLPVMTSALAAGGAVKKSGALYAATAFFDSFLSNIISKLLVPILYIYLCVAIVANLFSQPYLKDMKDFMKWLMTWGLKTVLYVFTGYISITGVVCGSTDAAMLKATKLTISGMVPVVGNILSDASEAVLVSAGVMRNAVGIYGLLAICALLIGPFVRIGVQYLLLKMTSGLCKMLGGKEMATLMNDFSSAMGLALAMTGSVCLIFLISTVCFLKGVS